MSADKIENIAKSLIMISSITKVFCMRKFLSKQICSNFHTTSEHSAKSKKPTVKTSLKTSENTSYLSYLNETSHTVESFNEKDLSVLRNRGLKYLPTKLSKFECSALTQLPTFKEKKNLLHLLYNKEQYKLKDARMSNEIKRIESPHHCRLNQSIGMDNIYNHRLITSKQLDGSIIFDHSYFRHLGDADKLFLAEDLAESVRVNKSSRDPFNLIFSNYDIEGEANKINAGFLPELKRDDCLIDLHRENFTEHFPRGKVVCLTPLANGYKDLNFVDPDVTYVLPALPPSVAGKQLHARVIAKAKQDGIAVQKLPIERFVVTKPLHLPLHVTMNILLDYRLNGSWKQAFEKFLPRYLLPNGQLSFKKVNERFLGPRLVLVPPAKKKAFPKLAQWLRESEENS